MRQAVLVALMVLLPAHAPSQVRAGAQAVDFALPDASGRIERLSGLRGKVVVVDFWASWCEPCMKELPELDRLQRELAGRGVVILALSIDKDRESALAVMRRMKLSLKVLLDPRGEVAERYDPPKMPTSYVIDRKGQVRLVNEGFEGAKDVARLRAMLLELTK